MPQKTQKILRTLLAACALAAGADRAVLYVTDSIHGTVLRAEPGVAGLPLHRPPDRT